MVGLHHGLDLSSRALCDLANSQKIETRTIKIQKRTLRGESYCCLQSRANYKHSYSPSWLNVPVVFQRWVSSLHTFYCSADFKPSRMPIATSKLHSESLHTQPNLAW
eukprot:2962074-Amphidinium_carterae.1